MKKTEEDKEQKLLSIKNYEISLDGESKNTVSEILILLFGSNPEGGLTVAQMDSRFSIEDRIKDIKKETS